MILNKRFRKYYLKYGLFFLFGIGVLIAIDWIQLLIPERLKFIIDMFTENRIVENDILNHVKIILLIAATVMCGRFLWRYTIFGTARKIETDIRVELFTHATKLPNSFYSREKVGGLMTYFTNDLDAMRSGFGQAILHLADGIFLGGFAIYRMIRINATMTLLSGIPLLLLLVLMIVIRRKLAVKFKNRQKSYQQMSDFTQENFSGISVIKAYVREIKEASLFKEKNEDYRSKNIGFIRYIAIVDTSISALLSLTVTSMLVYGSILIIKSGFSAGTLTQYISYFFSLLWPVMALSQFFQLASQGSASAKRLETFLDEEISVCDDCNVITTNIEVDGSIEFKHLTFTYPDGDEPVLKDVSFKINDGEMIGILGKTGSGKSSLVDLLLRVYNTPENSIFIGKYDIMKIPLKKVRAHIGYVPQDNFLFSDTITNNIGFAYDKPDMGVVKDAAVFSDVYDNIMDFTEGFETILGERGTTVSGGQKQRISIARAIAKNPEILILDDSVSAVDTKTEEAIINNLYDNRKGKTTIMIAHRISTVKRMDRIILLDEGKIVAIGNHEELLEKSYMYKDMVRRQELEIMIEGDV